MELVSQAAHMCQFISALMLLVY